MYGLVSGSGWLWIKTDNTAYQALVLVWLWCGNKKKKVGENNGQLRFVRHHEWRTQARLDQQGQLCLQTRPCVVHTSDLGQKLSQN